MKTDKLDAMLLHYPFETIDETLEAWSELVALRDAGSVRLIGMANTYRVATIDDVWRQGRWKPDIVQNRWHEENNWNKSVVLFCRKKGIQYE